MIAAPKGPVSQFSCTSSVILLSNPKFEMITYRTFLIDMIYDKNKNKLWTNGDQENVVDIPMQTLIIVLQKPMDFSAIMKFSESFNSGSSVLNVKPIAKADQIPDEMPLPPKPFPDDLSELKPNIEYALPDDLSKEYKDAVPKTRGIRKAVEFKRDNKPVTLLLYTNRFKFPVCTFFKK
jgi:hypothetical protein